MNALIDAGRTLQQFFLDTVESAVRTVGSWAKRLVLLYVVSAILVLVSLFALANALAWGVIELGLPPFAAWLILAVVTGGTGFAVYKAADGKHVVRAEDRNSRLGLNVRIVKTGRPKRRRTRTRSRRGAVVLHRTHRVQHN